MAGGREAQAFVLRGAHYAETHDPEGDLTPEEFHTPNVKTIADLARFTGLPETSQMKSLAMVADGEPVLALLRGDHQLNEAKLADVLDARQFEQRIRKNSSSGSVRTPDRWDRSASLRMSASLPMTRCAGGVT